METRYFIALAMIVAGLMLPILLPVGLALFALFLVVDVYVLVLSWVLMVLLWLRNQLARLL